VNDDDDKRFLVHSELKIILPVIAHYVHCDPYTDPATYSMVFVSKEDCWYGFEPTKKKGRYSIPSHWDCRT